jgi:hypothetical protein
LATVPFLADNLEPEPVCVAYWRRIWVVASAAPQQTATCVLRRLNTEICPAKGPVAVGAGVSLLGCRPSPRQPSWRGPDGWCRAPRTACRAVSPGAFAASGGVSYFFRRCQQAGGSFCAGPRRPGPVRQLAASPVAWLLARMWWSSGPLFPAPPLDSPALRAGASPGNTGNNPSAASSRKKSTLETPYRPVAAVAAPRRESRVVLVSSAARRPCQQARTAVPPHCLCRLSPCPVGFVQNPFVYRAKLNTAAFFAIYWRQGCIFNWPRSSSTIVYGICGEAVWMILFTQSACGNPHADRAFSSRLTSYSTRRIVGTESSSNK